MADFERPTPNSARARRAYSASPQELMAAVERAIEGLPRWSLLDSDDEKLSAVRRTRLFRFKDDVTVRVTTLGDGSEAYIESASRVGKGDLGQNRRNLKELLEAVNLKLG